MSTPTLTRAAELLECEAAILRESCTDADGEWSDKCELLRTAHDEMLRVAGELRAMIADAPQPPAEAAQPADVARPVAWARVHPDGSFAGDLLPDSQIEDVRKRSGAWVPLTRAQAAPADVALLQDAERYRWLRNLDWWAEPEIGLEVDGSAWRVTFSSPAPFENASDGSWLDAAIDAARKGANHD